MPIYGNINRELDGIRDIFELEEQKKQPKISCAGVWDFGNILQETERAAENKMEEMEGRKKEWRRNFSEQREQEDAEAQDSQK